MSIRIYVFLFVSFTDITIITLKFSIIACYVLHGVGKTHWYLGLVTCSWIRE